MLKMIFQNDDLMNEYPMNDEYFYHDYHSHYLYIQKQHHQKHIQRQNQYQNQTKKNHPHVKNETDEDWGFYVEIDPPTPPKHVFPKKNNNTHKNLAINPIPTPKSSSNQTCNQYSTQEKNVNYLPQIQEENHEDQFILDMDLHNDRDNNNDNNNDNDNYKEKITKNIFSGITICALTTVSIYFYNKIRSF